MEAIDGPRKYTEEVYEPRSASRPIQVLDRVIQDDRVYMSCPESCQGRNLNNPLENMTMRQNGQVFCMRKVLRAQSNFGSGAGPIICIFSPHRKFLRLQKVCQSESRLGNLVSSQSCISVNNRSQLGHAVLRRFRVHPTG